MQLIIRKIVWKWPSIYHFGAAHLLDEIQIWRFDDSVDLVFERLRLTQPRN